MAEAYQLKLNDSAGNARDFDFDQRKVVIGRDPSVDVVIDDVEISRKHLVITREKSGFFAEDQNSTNGSFLGKKRLTKKIAITNGDVLTLGQNHTLEFVVLAPEHEQTAEMAAEKGEVDLVETIVAEAEPIQPETVVEEEPEEVMLPVQGETEQKAKPKKAAKQRPTWLVVLLAALAFIVVFCVIPLIVIEATNQWCDLFAGFFNSMSPGVCP